MSSHVFFLLNLRWAELKNAYSYVIALRHRTWAQAGAHLKWLGRKLRLFKVKKQGRQWKDKSLVSLSTKENCFSKNLECTTSEKFVFVHETTQRMKCSVSQRLLVELDCSQNSLSSILSKVVIARKSSARTTLCKGVNFHWWTDRKRARKSQPHACADVFHLSPRDGVFSEAHLSVSNGPVLRFSSRILYPSNLGKFPLNKMADAGR